MLGYALRLGDSQALAYTQSVESLRNVDDPEIAAADVARLSRDTPRLRRAEAESHAQAARILTNMGAPPTLRRWAVRSAALLSAPLAFSDEARKLARTEPDSATVLAELDEIRAVKADADSEQTPLSLWLGITGGKVGTWTADVGAYAAGLRPSPARPGAGAAPYLTARALLARAPSGSPAAARESLAALVPTGGGNLQGLATVAPAAVPPEKVARVYQALLAVYGAEAQAGALNKSDG